MSEPRIVVIGGGTGSFVVLSGLKKYTSSITALVSMADDGGSTGQLRDELGALPPGDVRQCLVALSDSPRMRELFTYRFEEGSLRGHAVGNLFLTGLEKMTGSFVEAVEEASRVLAIRGRVEPITLDEVHMTIKTPSGLELKGQFVGTNADFKGEKLPEITLDQVAHINPAAQQAITDADMVVIAPGGLYTSIAPALVVGGVKEALGRTSAKLVYICNLVTKPGQTDEFSVTDYTDEITRFAGRQPDVVIYNNSPPSPQLLKRYAHDGEFPVHVNQEVLDEAPYEAIGLDLIAKHVWKTSSSDPIAEVRTFIRHDPDKLAKAIMAIDV